MKAIKSSAAPPPSDAAPVAWRVEVEKEGDEIIGPVRLVTGPGESWEIQGVDEDCYEDEAWAKLLCEKHNATLYAHPEDAPGGPWQINPSRDRWILTRIEPYRTIYGDIMSETEAVAVRDALNTMATPNTGTIVPNEGTK